MNKVHAQAYALFRSGFRYWFDHNDISLINERNKTYQKSSTEYELVLQYCIKGEVDPANPEKLKDEAASEWKTATSVAEAINLQSKYPLGRTSAVEFGKALRKAGFPSKQVGNVSHYAVSKPFVGKHFGMGKSGVSATDAIMAEDGGDTRG